MTDITAKVDISKDDNIKEDIISKDIVKVDISKDDNIKEDIISKDIIKVDISKDDTIIKDESIKESIKDNSIESSQTDNAVEEVKVQEAGADSEALLKKYVEFEIKQDNSKQESSKQESSKQHTKKNKHDNKQDNSNISFMDELIITNETHKKLRNNKSQKMNKDSYKDMSKDSNKDMSKEYLTLINKLIEISSKLEKESMKTNDIKAIESNKSIITSINENLNLLVVNNESLLTKLDERITTVSSEEELIKFQKLKELLPNCSDKVIMDAINKDNKNSKSDKPIKWSSLISNTATASNNSSVKINNPNLVEIPINQEINKQYTLSCIPITNFNQINNDSILYYNTTVKQFCFRMNGIIFNGNLGTIHSNYELNKINKKNTTRCDHVPCENHDCNFYHDPLFHKNKKYEQRDFMNYMIMYNGNVGTDDKSKSLRFGNLSTINIDIDRIRKQSNRDDFKDVVMQYILSYFIIQKYTNFL